MRQQSKELAANAKTDAAKRRNYSSSRRDNAMYLVGNVECLNARVKTNECLLVAGGAGGGSATACKRPKYEEQR